MKNVDNDYHIDETRLYKLTRDKQMKMRNVSATEFRRIMVKCGGSVVDTQNYTYHGSSVYSRVVELKWRGACSIEVGRVTWEKEGMFSFKDTTYTVPNYLYLAYIGESK